MPLAALVSGAQLPRGTTQLSVHSPSAALQRPTRRQARTAAALGLPASLRRGMVDKRSKQPGERAGRAPAPAAWKPLHWLHQERTARREISLGLPGRLLELR